MDATSSWDWSNLDNSSASQASASEPGPQLAEEQPFPAEPPESTHTETKPNPKTQQRRYGSRTCRICLETVHPTFPEASESRFSMPASSKPTYISEDPELGRLLSPCKCKGSQRYVHEGCLNAWRLTNPTATRNYWQCPTCKFTYRMARLHWAAALSSNIAKAALTIVILILCVFALGFVADPILDLWIDPLGTITDTVTNVITDLDAQKVPLPAEPTTWTEHFLKGFFSLGLVGLLKTGLAMSPFHWNIRVGGFAWPARRGGTGRARLENVNLLLVLVGVATFLAGIWRVVSAVSARVLKNVSDRVLDIGGDIDDDLEEDDGDDSRKDE